MHPDGCAGRDPEDPTCAKLTVHGKMKLVKRESDKQLAQRYLFARHPEMAGWPLDHKFQL